MSEREHNLREQTPSPAPESKDAQPVSPHPRTKSQKRKSRRSVFQYIAILFAAAFLLLLMTYLMERRTREAQIDDLEQSSTSTLQTLNNIIAERDLLREENETLKQQLDESEQIQQQAQKTLEEQQRTLEAMDWFWRIQRQFSRGYTRGARELAEAFEATGLPDALPDTSVAEPDGPSPKQQYQELHDLMF